MRTTRIDHKCDICQKPANVLMLGMEGTSEGIWYCSECAGEYESRNADDFETRARTCPYCDGNGVDWEGAACDYCDGYGYYWWEE